MTQLPAIATQAEFARLAGYKPGYVSQLKSAGRLVLDDSGKRILVAESIARIDETRDPSKAGVAARHAAQRAAKVAPEAAASPIPAEGEPDDEDTAPERPERPGSFYQDARARKEHYLALAAQRDYEESIGKLLESAQVCAAITDAATTLRTSLEAMPDILAPQLAAVSDEAECRAQLAEAIEHVLTELSRKFAAVIPAGAPT